MLHISLSREVVVIISASHPPPRRALLVALRRGGTAGSQYHVWCTPWEAAALHRWLDRRAQTLAPWEPATAEYLAEAAMVVAQAIAVGRA